MNYPLIILGIILTVLIAVAIQTIARARAMVLEEQSLLENEIAEFQRMRDEGSITDEEYKRLKRVVAEQSLEQAKQDQMR
jgi:hypothetical protein